MDALKIRNHPPIVPKSGTWIPALASNVARVLLVASRQAAHTLVLTLSYVLVTALLAVSGLLASMAWLCRWLAVQS